jgi:hypothetical protein
MPASSFLSDAWLDQVRAVKAAHAGTPIDQPGLVVNATVTGVPFGDATRLLHSTHGPVLGWEPGHDTAATLAIQVDYDLARQLILDTTFDVLSQAIDAGQIVIDGDVDELRSWWSHRIGNPDAVALDDEVRALTA